MPRVKDDETLAILTVDRKVKNGSPEILTLSTPCPCLGPQFDGDRQAVVERALRKCRFIEVGFDVPSSKSAIALAETAALAAAVGIHPHNAAECGDLSLVWRELRNLIAENRLPAENRPRVVAVGEIGLDYYRDLSPRALQAECFEMGLETAKDLDLPVIIHQRDAAGDTTHILRITACPPDNLPLFPGRPLLCEDCLFGWILGLGGTITYPKNTGLRDLLKYIPLDRMLGDGRAVSSTRPARCRNEPAYVRETLNTLAQARQRTCGSSEITRDNALRAFDP